MFALNVILLVLAEAVCLYGQPTPYGTSFAFSFPPIRASLPAGEDDCFIFINSRVDTTARILWNDGLFNQNVPAGSIVRYDADCNDRLDPSVEGGIENKAYYVTSDDPISVMVANADGRNNMDAVLLYPLPPANASSFYIAQYVNMDDDTILDCGVDTDMAGFFTVTASKDATTPTNVQVYAPDPYRLVAEFTLDPFGTYMESTTVEQRQIDYTGYYITANDSVTVASGSSCTDATEEVGDTEGVTWAQMPPVSVYVAGEFITFRTISFAFEAPQDNYYRIVILASEDNTVTSVAGVPQTLMRGQTRQFEFFQSFDVVSCDKPCMVLQVNENNEDDAGIFMAQVTPVDYYGTYAAFSGTRALYQSYIRIITLNSSYVSDIVLNGITEQQPWECTTLSNGKEACDYLGILESSFIQGTIETNNPFAKFTALCYWSFTEGRGYGFNIGFGTPSIATTEL